MEKVEEQHNNPNNWHNCFLLRCRTLTYALTNQRIEGLLARIIVTNNIIVGHFCVCFDSAAS